MLRLEQDVSFYSCFPKDLCTRRLETLVERINCIVRVHRVHRIPYIQTCVVWLMWSSMRLKRSAIIRGSSPSSD